MDHRGTDAAAAVLFEGVARGEDQGVQLAEAAVDGAGVAPGLGRAAAGEGAADAVGAVAGLPVVLPEQVHRADQPVLVRRHQADRRAAELEHAGAADERDVVEVDDVGVDGVEGLAEGLGLEERPAGHLRGQRREHAEPRLERVDVQPPRRCVGAERVVAADGVECVHAMEDVDLMPAAHEGPRQAIDVSGVAAEAVGPEERRHHADLHGRPPCRPCPDSPGPRPRRLTRKPGIVPVRSDRTRPRTAGTIDCTLDRPTAPTPEARSDPCRRPPVCPITSPCWPPIIAAFAAELQAMVACLPIREGDRVVELACGDGAYSPWLADRVGPSGLVVAVDVSPEYLKSGAGRVARHRRMRPRGSPTWLRRSSGSPCPGGHLRPLLVRPEPLQPPRPTRGHPDDGQARPAGRDRRGARERHDASGRPALARRGRAGRPRGGAGGVRGGERVTAEVLRRPPSRPAFSTMPA